MGCRYCQRPIGFLRRLRDAGFCCEAHRRAMGAVSARVARELDEFSDSEAFWPVIHTVDTAHPNQSSAGSTLLFGLVIVTALLIGTSSFDLRDFATSNESGEKVGLTAWLRQEGALSYRDDFSSGLAAWKGRGANDGWTRVNGLVHPGRLRLWSETERLADYEFEFEGQIENRAVGWAYRAKDLHNYYASKIVLTGTGPLPRAELVRYSVIAGLSGAKTRLPLPILIRKDTIYNVQVNVRGNHFSTLVNGQMVDTWSDNRLRQGGVGLFADPGDDATVHYAAVNSRTGKLGELLSFFGFWMPATARPVPTLILR